MFKKKAASGASISGSWAKATSALKTNMATKAKTNNRIFPAVNLFILWRHTRKSFNTHHRSIHVALHLSEMCPASHTGALVVVCSRDGDDDNYILRGSLSWLRSGRPIAPKDYYFWDSVAKGLAYLLLLVRTVGKKQQQLLKLRFQLSLRVAGLSLSGKDPRT